MNKINISAVPVEETKSPKGKFHASWQDIAKALATNNGGKTQLAGAPFEVELVRVPPRAANFPLHSHTAQWEFYLIVSGRGKMRTPAGTSEISEGDCIMHPPGEAHQIINSGATDLVYYVVADNPPSDNCHYPDSNKWHVKGAGKTFRLTAANYYDGEE